MKFYLTLCSLNTFFLGRLENGSSFDICVESVEAILNKRKPQLPQNIVLEIRTKNPKKKGWKKATFFKGCVVEHIPSSIKLSCSKEKFETLLEHYRLFRDLKTQTLFIKVS